MASLLPAWRYDKLPPHAPLQVPLQRHAGDSALFMCTNALYLLAGLPGQLTPMAADVVSRFRDTDIDLFEGSKSCYPGGRSMQGLRTTWVGALFRSARRLSQCESRLLRCLLLAPSKVPSAAPAAGFLTREWYSPQAAEALRKELAAALRRELEQVGPLPGAWHAVLCPLSCGAYCRATSQLSLPQGMLACCPF